MSASPRELAVSGSASPSVKIHQSDEPYRSGRAVRLAADLAGRVGARLRGRARRPEPGRPYRVLFVASSGGHLAQLMTLSDWWEDQERRWVTFDTADARSALANEEWIGGHHPTTRNVGNLIRNTGLAMRYFRGWRPDVIVSTGAGLAVPFFWIGRLIGVRTAYLEVYDRVDSTTLTGRMVHAATDLFIVQWPEQQRLYSDAVVGGTVW